MKELSEWVWWWPKGKEEERKSIIYFIVDFNMFISEDPSNNLRRLLVLISHFTDGKIEVPGLSDKLKVTVLLGWEAQL